ncbi:MAG: putative diguanylate cyclase/phosphodiesterase with sensor [Acidimicrobiales bacterium]|nr:putative diguanylate cyclase/phosphodiesterase with sensor [Acidimicrobiales bacterium]
MFGAQPAKRARRFISLCLLLAATAVLIGGIVNTSRLQTQASGHLTATLELSELQTGVLELARSVRGALLDVPEGASADDTPATIDQAIAHLHQLLDEAGSKLTPSEAAHLRVAAQPEIDAASDVARLLRGRQTSAAGRLINQREEPAFAIANRAIGAMAGRNYANAVKTQNRGDRNFVLTLVATALAFAALAGSAVATRWRADRARLATDAMRRSEARFRALVHNGGDVIVVLDDDGVVQDVSDSIERVLGVLPAHVIGRHMTDVVHPDEVVGAAALLDRTLAAPSGLVDRVEWRARDATGAWRDLEVSITRLRDQADATGLVLNVRDTTDRHRLEAELRHRAFHDSLTGLANRALLHDRIGQTLLRRHSAATALLVLDLDGFKQLNDSLGHPGGDYALTVVADRLRGAVRSADTVARIGGDEFAVLLDDVSDEAEVVGLAHRLIALVSEPIAWHEREMVVGTCIGIAFVDPPVRGVDDLVRNADTALYSAKAAGRTELCVFEPTMHATVSARFELESELRRALSEPGELILHYQPIVELASQRLIGFEALARWWHPRRGLVSPMDFIPVAEDSGLIVDLGRTLLAQACTEAVGWAARPGFEDLQIAVNLSVRQLRDAALVDDTRSVLTSTGLSPDRLMLEITESELMHDVDFALERLGQLKRLGLRLAVDDFGTGYSSLSRLRRFPFDTVKIDQSFVAGATSSEELAFLGAIVSLGHSLNLETLAEGIETEAQATILENLGCRLGQGYFFGHPMDAAALGVLLDDLARQRRPHHVS